MEVAAKYGCLTVLDLGEDYAESKVFAEYQDKLNSLHKDLNRYLHAQNKEKTDLLLEYSTSSFVADLRKNPENIDAIFSDFVVSRKYWLMKEVSELTLKLGTHYKCQCKCGKLHYFTEKTLASEPDYCSYPVYISTRGTYSVKAANSTYHKKQKYADLMNVVIVSTQSACVPSDSYCGLWNKYKRKQMNKVSVSAENNYTVVEWDENGKSLGTYAVCAITYLDALKKLYPNVLFELCSTTDLRNTLLLCGRDFTFKVTNNSGKSTQTRYYKRI